MFKGCPFRTWLDNVEENVRELYHKDGAGRPPRSDPELRGICDVEDYRKPYHPSQLCRFRKRVGPERLGKIINSLIGKLVDARVIKGGIVACDATFIKAYSKRDPHDDSRGHSHSEAKVDRAGKTYQLGYKLQLAVDSESELQLALIAAPANENEKKHASKLIEKVVKATKGNLKVFVADAQYSSQKFRRDSLPWNKTGNTISNKSASKREGIPTVDKQFRTRGSFRLKACTSIDHRLKGPFSTLKQHLSREHQKVRDLNNIAAHVLLCIISMLLIALTAPKLEKAESIKSITCTA
ncbi:MAG: transposase [Candidatus Bathyarchaeia archaeon]